MTWMPEVFTVPIAEARREQDAASANDTVPYYEGIMANQPEALVRSFAGEPRVNDPRVGHVEGTRELHAFVNGTANWLREREAVVENVALTLTATRTVEEVVLHLLSEQGTRVELPVAVASDRNPDRTLKAIRVYHSMWPLTGRHTLRPPLLPEDPSLHAKGTSGDYQRALAEGDLEGIVGTFEPEGYAREPSGGAYLRRGAAGAIHAPVRQRRRHSSGALHPHRRRGAQRHRVKLRALGGDRHPATGWCCGLRAREERAAGGCAHLRRCGAAGPLGHVRRVAETSENTQLLRDWVNRAG
jgi:hypothetical protein